MKRKRHIRENRIGDFIVSILVCQSAGILGSFVTDGSVTTWYATLNKPLLAPPNWLFGPVWLALYTLMGIALFLVWEKGFDKPKVKVAIKLFIFHLAVNALWSVVFFGLNQIFAGLLVILLLLALIFLVIIAFYPLDWRAALLLVPYLFWVSFAAYLNYAIWLLNRGAL